jgi:hypothetical protein
MVDRLRAFGSDSPESSGDSVQHKPLSPLASLVRYQKRGTGIATSFRAQIHAFSFVLLRAFKSHSGAPELLDFNVEQIKLKLEGCMSALSGDCTALLSVNSFNSEVEDWEYAVEPFPFALTIEQMPNELVRSLSPLLFLPSDSCSYLLPVSVFRRLNYRFYSSKFDGCNAAGSRGNEI